MTEIEKLVEKVTRIICLYGDCCNWQHCTLDGEPAHECPSVGKAKQILFGNNLAIIDDEGLPDEITIHIPLLENILEELGWRKVTPLEVKE